MRATVSIRAAGVRGRRRPANGSTRCAVPRTSATTHCSAPTTTSARARSPTATGHRPVDMAPLTSIAMAAARTTTLRVGCRVFCCDFHHPVVLAKEMATLDVLSEGRLDVGLGAGWVRDEYDGLGVTMERPSVRIAKLAEYVDVMRAHWSGARAATCTVQFVDVSGFAGLPRPVQAAGPADHDRRRGAEDPRARRPARRHRQPQLQQRVRPARQLPA